VAQELLRGSIKQPIEAESGEAIFKEDLVRTENLDDSFSRQQEGGAMQVIWL
jgi:hypothetical protein